MDTYSYELRTIDRIADNVFEIVVDPESEALSYQAGQYVEFLYPDGNYYPFSIGNAPTGTGELVFYVRQMPDDHALQAFLLDLEQIGELQLRGPMGECYYRPPKDKPIVLVAGGTGIAQIKAIVEAADENDDLHVFWGVTSPSELFLHDYFSELVEGEKVNSFVPLVSGHEPWHGKNGWVHEEVLEHFPDLSDVIVYASGPFEMVNEARNLYARYGLNLEHFYTDVL